MSFRDLRKMMRALGYNRLVSMENFRSPNFALVAEILIWLVKRFDPDSDVHSQYNTDEDRVLLIRTVAQFMALKANIMLNTKRLYQADGYAVKELLKITSLLYDALQVHMNDNHVQTQVTSNDMVDLSSKIQDLKLSRELASLVTTKGATLYELLGKEVELREIRNSSISTQLELNTIEKGLKQAIANTKDSIENIKSMIENVSATESSLDSKIEKKQGELDRNQKRLQTLKKVRPAFLEEFEKLEVELQGLYQEYITKVRCISYLDHVQEEAAAAEQERMLRKQKETRKLMEELQLEDARKLMENDDDEVDESLDPQKEDLKVTPQRRLRTATASKARLTTGRKRVFGGMNVDEDDSDSDLLLDDDDEDDNSELIGSGEEINGIPGESNLSEQSDDDF